MLFPWTNNFTPFYWGVTNCKGLASSALRVQGEQRYSYQQLLLLHATETRISSNPFGQSETLPFSCTKECIICIIYLSQATSYLCSTGPNLVTGSILLSPFFGFLNKLWSIVFEFLRLEIETIHNLKSKTKTKAVLT